jgi:hypothetical protein
MMDLSLVNDNKPKQLSMAWVMNLFDSDEWALFLKKRQPLL